MLALVAAIVLSPAFAPPANVSDFFPLVAGSTWRYEESSGKQIMGMTEDKCEPKATVERLETDKESKKEIVVEAKQAIPIASYSDGKKIDTVFYEIRDDVVYLVAFGPKGLLKDPYPVLKFGSGSNKWDYSGSTVFMGRDTQLVMKGSSKKSGVRDVLGDRLETVEVTLEVVLMPGTSIPIKKSQVAIYAKGVGLVEMRETTIVNKNKRVATRKLVSYSPGKG
jgi:hypothetical protein